jgi:hypothetical protein
VNLGTMATSQVSSHGSRTAGSDTSGPLDFVDSRAEV